jgi:hypothetical protein
VHVLPQLPLLIPVDYIYVPVVDMIICQFFSKWREYLIASTAAAAVLAFVLEPIAVGIGMYHLVTWRYIYSFPIYILINIIAKFMTERFKARQAAA